MAERVKVLGSDGKEYLRQPCDIRTRCMGYYAPLVRMNTGKRSEFFSRKYFVEGKTPIRNFGKEESMIQANKDFITKYMTHETA